MREIGGYIELDTYRLPMLHEGAVALNCGRNALAYLLGAKHIKRIWLPRFLCDSVPNVCAREGVAVSWYRIGTDFRPAEDIPLKEDEWFYLVNYYGQLSNEEITGWRQRCGRLIVDSAQSYFQKPVEGVDTLYTCRKYFGVADGAFLYTDAVPREALPTDVSYERMRFLLGRYECGANAFYSEYTLNNKRFADEPVKRMSRLTENLLHGIDYEAVRRQRVENFRFLHTCLGGINELKSLRDGTFMYPLMLPGGTAIRKQLQEKQIYIPTLWPNVLKTLAPKEAEYCMAEQILPLPTDQRYGIDNMEYLVREVLKCLENCKGKSC